MNNAHPTPFARKLKRAIVVTMIVSFSAAAVGGIIVLLGDIWSETAGQVLGTTALTGVTSVAVFCGATLIGKPVQWFGILTVAVSVCTLALLLALIWFDAIFETIGWEWVSTAPILTAVGAISSLILLLVRHRSWLVRISLAVTLGLIALGTALSLYLVWVEEAYDIEWLLRLVGIVWILAALGTIVVPVSSLLLRQSTLPEQSPPEQTQSVPGEVDAAGQLSGADQLFPPAQASSAQTIVGTLSPTSVHRINSAASAAGITPDELVERLLGSEAPDGPVDPSQ